MQFKQFLLNESTAYLSQRIGDITSAIQELNNNINGMGAREILRNAQTIVNQIRRILHTNWSKEDLKYLSYLQKVGAAIMRGIESKDDLKQILLSSVSELEKLSSKIGEPINSIVGQKPPEPKESPLTLDQDNV